MLWQSAKMAVKAIWGNKTRSFLTILGILIGIIAITVLISIGQGANDSVVSTIEGIGTNILQVSILTEDNPLTLEKVEQDLREMKQVLDVAPTQSASGGQLKWMNNTVTARSVTGTTAAYPNVKSLPLEKGRFITQADIDNVSYVTIIGATIAEDLFAGSNPIGETVTLSGVPYTIVGVLTKNESGTINSTDNLMFIPLTLAQKLAGTSKVTAFTVAAWDSDGVNDAEVAVKTYLNDLMPDTSTSSSSSSRRRAYGIGGFLQAIGTSNDDDNSNYSIYNQSTILDALSEATATLSLMLGGIAGISLLVGGIGIMNMMLTSVTERTREIGIRKAIGATRGNILFQFLVEALILCLLGGALGLGLSALILQVLTRLLSMSLSVSLPVIEMALGFSLVIGLIFGIYPANKAAKCKPIDALHFNG
jgi:putative ABC transport system permease protein